MLKVTLKMVGPFFFNLVFSTFSIQHKILPGAVVVVQLVEQSLPISEVRSLNPDIGKNLYWAFTIHCIEKAKIKKKRPGMAHLKNCRWLDTNLRPLTSEATTLPTEPQPLSIVGDYATYLEAWSLLTKMSRIRTLFSDTFLSDRMIVTSSTRQVRWEVIHLEGGQQIFGGKLEDKLLFSFNVSPFWKLEKVIVW